jgi:microsomal prostaglandin-E synthase 2
MQLTRQPPFSVASSSIRRRHFTTPADDDNKEQSSDLTEIRLYQYAICPFCNRVKALLDYSGVHYDATEVNPLTKAEIKWSKDYRKVPIAQVSGQAVFGSDAIVQRLLEQPQFTRQLEKQWQGSSMTLEQFQSKSAQQWSTFAQEELAALLYPNMSRTLADSYAAFGYVEHVPTFSWGHRLAIRAVGSLAMTMAASRVKSTY